MLQQRIAASNDFISRMPDLEREIAIGAVEIITSVVNQPTFSTASRKNGRDLTMRLVAERPGRCGTASPPGHERQ